MPRRTTSTWLSTKCTKLKLRLKRRIRSEIRTSLPRLSNSNSHPRRHKANNHQQATQDTLKYHRHIRRRRHIKVKAKALKDIGSHIKHPLDS